MPIATSSTRLRSSGSRCVGSIRENVIRPRTTVWMRWMPWRASRSRVSSSASFRMVELRADQLEVRRQIAERIVDLVRDAGGERADRREPIGDRRMQRSIFDERVAAAAVGRPPRAQSDELDRLRRHAHAVLELDARTIATNAIERDCDARRDRRDGARSRRRPGPATRSPATDRGSRRARRSTSIRRSRGPIPRSRSLAPRSS